MPKIEMLEITQFGNEFTEASRSLPLRTPAEKEMILSMFHKTKTTHDHIQYNIGMWLAVEKHAALPNYLTFLSILCDDADINPLNIIRLLSTRHDNEHTLFSLIMKHRYEDNDYFDQSYELYNILIVKLAGKSTPVFFELCNSGLMCVPEHHYNMHKHFAKYKGEVRDYICNLPEQTASERAFKIQTLKNARNINHPLCQIFLTTRRGGKCRMKSGSLGRLGKVLERLERPVSQPSRILGFFSRWVNRNPEMISGLNASDYLPGSSL